MTTKQQERIYKALERFAEQEHTRWSKWQEYFFSKCLIKPQSEVGGMDDRYIYFALPKDLYERWCRQINTLYLELSEQEKESDRREVKPYLTFIQSEVDLAVAEREKEILEMMRQVRQDWESDGQTDKLPTVDYLIRLITSNPTK